MQVAVLSSATVFTLIRGTERRTVGTPAALSETKPALVEYLCPSSPKKVSRLAAGWSSECQNGKGAGLDGGVGFRLAVMAVGLAAGATAVLVGLAVSLLNPGSSKAPVPPTGDA
jgi:hypothetical protein